LNCCRFQDTFSACQVREDDPVDQESHQPVFCAEFILCGLGSGGCAALAFESTRPAAVAFLALFMVLRTAFLITLETPEPRYVLVCFPALMGLGAQVFARRSAV